MSDLAHPVWLDDGDEVAEDPRHKIARINRERGQVISPACATMLYLHNTQLRSVQGLEEYVSVRVLHLENNCLTSCAGLGHLPCLRALFLQQNSINSLEGLSTCTSLVTLNVSNNPLGRLKSGSLPASLLTLQAASTGLRDAADLAHLAADCPDMQVLDLQHNQCLADPSNMMLPALCQLKSLRVLYMQGCGLVNSSNNYRRVLISALPCLHYLDNGPVDDVERAGACAWLKGGRDAEQAARLAMRREHRLALRRTSVAFAVERAKRRLAQALGQELASVALAGEETEDVVRQLVDGSMGLGYPDITDLTTTTTVTDLVRADEDAALLPQVVEPLMDGEGEPGEGTVSLVSSTVDTGRDGVSDREWWAETLATLKGGGVGNAGVGVGNAGVGVGNAGVGVRNAGVGVGNAGVAGLSGTRIGGWSESGGVGVGRAGMQGLVEGGGVVGGLQTGTGHVDDGDGLDRVLIPDDDDGGGGGELGTAAGIQWVSSLRSFLNEIPFTMEMMMMTSTGGGGGGGGGGQGCIPPHVGGACTALDTTSQDQDATSHTASPSITSTIHTAHDPPPISSATTDRATDTEPPTHANTHADPDDINILIPTDSAAVSNTAPDTTLAAATLPTTTTTATTSVHSSSSPTSQSSSTIDITLPCATSAPPSMDTIAPLMANIIPTSHTPTPAPVPTPVSTPAHVPTPVSAPTPIPTPSRDCAVCADDLLEGQLVVCLPCGHIFHAPCVKRWILTGLAKWGRTTPGMGGQGGAGGTGVTHGDAHHPHHTSSTGHHDSPRAPVTCPLCRAHLALPSWPPISPLHPQPAVHMPSSHPPSHHHTRTSHHHTSHPISITSTYTGDGMTRITPSHPSISSSQDPHSHALNAFTDQQDITTSNTQHNTSPQPSPGDDAAILPTHEEHVTPPCELQPGTTVLQTQHLETSTTTTTVPIITTTHTNTTTTTITSPTGAPHRARTTTVGIMQRLLGHPLLQGVSLNELLALDQELRNSRPRSGTSSDQLDNHQQDLQRKPHEDDANDLSLSSAGLPTNTTALNTPTAPTTDSTALAVWTNAIDRTIHRTRQGRSAEVDAQLADWNKLQDTLRRRRQQAEKDNTAVQPAAGEDVLGCGAEPTDPMPVQGADGNVCAKHLVRTSAAVAVTPNAAGVLAKGTESVIADVFQGRADVLGSQSTSAVAVTQQQSDRQLPRMSAPKALQQTPASSQFPIGADPTVPSRAGIPSVPVPAQTAAPVSAVRAGLAVTAMPLPSSPSPIVTSTIQDIRHVVALSLKGGIAPGTTQQASVTPPTDTKTGPNVSTCKSLGPQQQSTGQAGARQPSKGGKQGVLTLPAVHSLGKGDDDDVLYDDDSCVSAALPYL